MSLKKGLVKLLRDADIVGNSVWTNRKPEGGDYPAIVFRYVASEHISTLAGVNATQMRRIQFDCVGKTAKDAETVAQALHDLLDGYRGVLSENTVVQSCLPSGDVDIVDEELQLVTVAVDFNIWFVPGEYLASLSPPIIP